MDKQKIDDIFKIILEGETKRNSRSSKWSTIKRTFNQQRKFKAISTIWIQSNLWKII